MTTQKKENLFGLELFFRTLLQEIYWCELHLRDVLENMEERASTEELKSALRTHKLETNDHVHRLEKIFYQKDMGAQPVFCIGMQGLFDEGWQVIDETEEGSAHRDAALIVAAQKVEHYEIAAYGSLSTLAKTLGYRDAVGLLDKTLTDEKKTDAILTALAEKGINTDASIEPATEEQLLPPDTGSMAESEPAMSAIREATTGMDAGAGSMPVHEGAEASAPGSADALLADHPKDKKKPIKKR